MGVGGSGVSVGAAVGGGSVGTAVAAGVGVAVGVVPQPTIKTMSKMTKSRIFIGQLANDIYAIIGKRYPVTARWRDSTLPL